MAGKDEIVTGRESLYVLFGATGETRSLNVIRWDRGVSFCREGANVHIRYHDGGAAALLERFPDDRLAEDGLRRLQTKIRRRFRYRRLAGAAKGVAAWGVAPLAALTLGLALNAAVTGTAGTPAPAAPISGPDVASVRAPARPTELAAAMADGVRAGKYSVPLSEKGTGALYVFSDPLCPHCRNLEPELDQLSAEYIVHVFPVSVIGGEESALQAAKTLCAGGADRVARWKTSIAGVTLSAAACSDGAAAVLANDKIFRMMRLKGVPTLVNAAGEQMPDSLPSDAASVGKWLRSSLSETPQ
jgi:TrbB protein